MLARGVPFLQRHVLDDEPGRGLILAVRRGPHLGRITGVHVQDAPGPAAAERHLPAAVEHHLGTGVTNLGGGLHHDRHWLGTAVEGDHTALGDGDLLHGHPTRTIEQYGPVGDVAVGSLRRAGLVVIQQLHAHTRGKREGIAVGGDIARIFAMRQPEIMLT